MRRAPQLGQKPRETHERRPRHAFLFAGSISRHLDRDSCDSSALPPMSNPTTTGPILPATIAIDALFFLSLRQSDELAARELLGDHLAVPDGHAHAVDRRLDDALVERQARAPEFGAPRVWTTPPPRAPERTRPPPSTKCGTRTPRFLPLRRLPHRRPTGPVSHRAAGRRGPVRSSPSRNSAADSASSGSGLPRIAASAATANLAASAAGARASSAKPPPSSSTAAFGLCSARSVSAFARRMRPSDSERSGPEAGQTSLSSPPGNAISPASASRSIDSWVARNRSP